MEQYLCSNLPSEISINILSRLPARTIAISKCVCKPWHDLLESDEFISSYLSKAAPALAVIVPEKDSYSCKIFEFDDELALESYDLRYNPIAELDFSGDPILAMEDAALGLLLLRIDDNLRLCNPITREYLDLRCSREFVVETPYRDDVSYGFDSTYGIGASKVTGQYKVLRIDHISRKCHVYTLGTRKWRRIQTDASFPFFESVCAFLNGNLHWVSRGSLDSASICCFDVEAECFSSLLAPTLQGSNGYVSLSLSVLKGCLCFCDSSCDKTVIWLMKEYRVDESWSKEFVVEVNPCFDGYGYDSVNPIRVFKNGDILMVENQNVLLYYSNKSKTAREIGWFGSRRDCSLVAPSFVSLKSLSLGKENVISF